MTFRSPWQSPFFTHVVAVMRLILRPWGSLEDRFITHITQQQNNRIGAFLRKNPAENILLIMPRCVKKTGCKAPVQQSLTSCMPCNDCPLGDVARLCALYDVRALVAFRSHHAFEIARRDAPDLIIATACGDRLIKALRSVPGIPALLAPLTGMEKQCINAGIDLEWLNTQLSIATAKPIQPVSLTPASTNTPLSPIKKARTAQGF